MVTYSSYGQDFVFEEKITSTATDRNTLDAFGSSVAVYDSIMVVGAPRNDRDASGGSFISDAGAAYVYKRSATGEWILQEKLLSPNRKAFDHFGASVAVYGDFVIVGGPDENFDTLGKL